MPFEPGSPQIYTDPYSYINQPKQSILSRILSLLKNMSFKGKIIALVGGTVVIVILIFGLKSLFGSSGLNMPSIYGVLGEQQELINLSTTGTQQSNSSQSYLNFSTTELASASTDQNNLTSLLAKNGIKISASNYILQPSADNQLKQAINDSNFDPIYASVMQTQLKLYQNNLSYAYNLTTSSILRSYLSTDYKNTDLMIKMLNSSSG